MCFVIWRKRVNVSCWCAKRIIMAFGCAYDEHTRLFREAKNFWWFSIRSAAIYRFPGTFLRIRLRFVHVRRRVIARKWLKWTIQGRWQLFQPAMSRKHLPDATAGNAISLHVGSSCPLITPNRKPSICSSGTRDEKLCVFILIGVERWVVTASPTLN